MEQQPTEIRHIWRFPEDLDFVECVHRPIIQLVHFLKFPCNIETSGGTVPARVGDCLMVGKNGLLYPIQRAEYDDLFDLK